jgi:hypothetical protein
MRSLLVSTLVLCLAVSASRAAVVIGNYYTRSAACSYTQKDATGEGGAVENALGRYSTNIWIGGDWTAGSAYTLRRVDVNVSSVVGDPSGHTYYAYIYSYNAGADDPDAVLDNGTSDALSGISGTGTQSFLWATGPSLSNATVYCLVLKKDGSADGSNYIKIGYKNTGTESVWQSSDGSTWNDLDTTAEFTLTTYSCE